MKLGWKTLIAGPRAFFPGAHGTTFALPPFMTSSKLLEQIMFQLGKTADEVATTLRAHRVKGVRNTVRYLNPIVRFAQLQLHLDDYGLDVTHGDGMATYLLRITLPTGEEQVAFPGPVKEFFDGFNQGQFPDLELPHDRA